MPDDHSLKSGERLDRRGSEAARALPLMRPTVQKRLAGLSHAPLRAALEKALGETELSVEELVLLFSAPVEDLDCLVAVAHLLRLEQAPDFVTYVVNRNINFTNICYNACRFCAYSRPGSSPDAFFLGADDILRRAAEAHALGATEVCLQAGLAPDIDGDFYPNLCRLIHRALPALHIHAFSPQEIAYGARRSRKSIREYLGELKEAGLCSLPGTSAEILDDGVRKAISPARISTSEWIDVITEAHNLGIRTTATMMYGHVESLEARARHLLLIRDLQRATGGFTEFVPLSLIAQNDEASPRARYSLERQLSETDVIKTHAIARIAIGREVPNIQVSWVKEGLRIAEACLGAGANDLGGTLIEERISSSAGASHGQLMRPHELRASIRRAGFVPAERNTLYKILRRFDDPLLDPQDPLDLI